MCAAALAACMAAVLGGCTTAKPVIVSNHPHAFAIDCSGASLTWSHCYQKAGKACPEGYTVTQKPYKHNERIAAGDFLQLLGNSAAHRRMLIECRDGHGYSTAPASIPETPTPSDADDGDTSP